MPAEKEPNFFAADENWQRGAAWYESFFAEARSEKAVGEASTTYSKFPVIREVPARMARVLDMAHLRLLYIVRHPIDRMVSHHLHRWYEGEAGPSLAATLEADPQMLACSRYYQQIEQYLPFVSPEQWLVVVFEEFVADTAAVHKAVFEFLGVDLNFVPRDLAPKNVTSSKVRRAGWAEALRRISLIQRAARHLVPEKIRIRLTRSADRRPDKPAIPPALYNRLLEELMPDVSALSDFAHRDFAKIWGLEAR